MARFSQLVCALLLAGGAGYALVESVNGSRPRPASRDAVAPAALQSPDGTERLSFVPPDTELRFAQPSSVAMAAPEEKGSVVEPPRGVVVDALASAANGRDPNGSGGSHHRLAELIQTELKRVGCYAGSIDGEWGPESRRAMKAFNDRIDARLPVSAPDYILLTLLQGHAAMACGSPCPMGQAQGANGTCQPRGVIAEARRQAAARLEAMAATAAATAASALRSSETDRAALAAGRASDEEAGRDSGAGPDARAGRPVNEARPAQAEAPAADLAASEVRRLRQAAEAKARAEAEQARIAAIEARRRQDADAWQAKAEADRLARLAEAEKARMAAEARRREELAALAAREAKARHVAATKEIAKPGQLAIAGQPAGQEDRRFSGVTSSLGIGDDIAPSRLTPQAARETRPKQQAPRFVGRFVPPPQYRLGRQPPPPPRGRPFLPASRAAPRGPQGIFGYTLRHSP